ncbi:hypothetical protein GMOD_00010197 [Pyrenophora seminiperda CCB06]|uniref:Uncharacterized protein n=1 Tax=Pyrenophora seminiperda CCB06 TaxID=1302712 RepID=A0A3M7M5W8_9PLEO|nr:hypothetical protein GMOD_00010197 [Pyrenophora seminiperda CCB06]
MSNMQDNKAPRDLSLEEWPELPPSRPAVDLPTRTVRKVRPCPEFNSLHFHVSPYKKPEACRDKRVWRVGEKAMTYTEWLGIQKDRDDAFLIWKDTEEGKRQVQWVMNLFPGLPQTLEDVSNLARLEDVSEFVREMSMPSTPLRCRWHATLTAQGATLTDWDATLRDTVANPRLSCSQMKALVLLTSPNRSLPSKTIDKTLFAYTGVYGDPGQHWRDRADKDNSYDCLFPRYGYLQGNIRGWDREQTVAKQVIIGDPNYTLPPGEERMIMTARYELHDPLYYDAPPYIAASRLYPGEISHGIEDLPPELFEKILKRVGLLEGSLVVSRNSSHEWGLSNQSPSNKPSDTAAFRCRVVLPRHRSIISPEKLEPWLAHPKFNVYRLLGLRTVNLIYRIRFTYEDEIVYLGASCKAGKIVYGHNTPWDSIPDRNKDGDFLFRDDEGYLAVRAFRIKFDFGSRYSGKWGLDILRRLHQRGDMLVWQQVSIQSPSDRVVPSETTTTTPAPTSNNAHNSRPTMSSKDCSTQHREGILDAIRNTLHSLSCTSHREPSHSYKNMAPSDQAQIVYANRPNLPRQLSYCALPRGICRMSAPAKSKVEDPFDDRHKITESEDEARPQSRLEMVA